MTQPEHQVWSTAARARGEDDATPVVRLPSRSEQVFRRRLSPAVFALVALAFFLPFATVSCGDASTTFTGVQLVTKSAPRSGDADIDAGVRRRAPIALVILLAAVTGALLGIAGGAWFVVRPGVCAAVGLLGTLALPFEVMGPDITVHSGYLTVVFGFIALCIAHLAFVVRWRFDDSRAPLRDGAGWLG